MTHCLDGERGENWGGDIGACCKRASPELGAESGSCEGGCQREGGGKGRRVHGGSGSGEWGVRSWEISEGGRQDDADERLV